MGSFCMPQRSYPLLSLLIFKSRRRRRKGEMSIEAMYASGRNDLNTGNSTYSKEVVTFSTIPNMEAFPYNSSFPLL